MSSFASHKQTKWVIPQQLSNENGSIVTVTEVRTELLENFQTKLMEDFVVLYFKECKPMPCKNPVLDALDELFPFCQIQDIVGQQLVLHGEHGKSGKNEWYVVRVDKIATLRLQTPDNIPEAMKRGAPNPNAGLGPTAPEALDEEPPPPTDADSVGF